MATAIRKTAIYSILVSAILVGLLFLPQPLNAQTIQTVSGYTNRYQVNNNFDGRFNYPCNDGRPFCDFHGNRYLGQNFSNTQFPVNQFPINQVNNRGPQVEVNKDGDTIVSWDTASPSRGYVLYGLQSQPNQSALRYEFSTPRSGAISTMHSVNLGELQEDRPYYLRVVSEIGSERSVSSELSFVRESSETIRARQAASANILGSGIGQSYNPLTSFFLLVIIVILLVVLIRKKKGKVFIKN